MVNFLLTLLKGLCRRTWYENIDKAKIARPRVGSVQFYRASRKPSKNLAKPGKNLAKPSKNLAKPNKDLATT